MRTITKPEVRNQAHSLRAAPRRSNSLLLCAALCFPIVISIVLGGCASTLDSNRTIPHGSPQTTSRSELLLHSFGPGVWDGQFPAGSLLDVHGTLYGAAGGGKYNNGVIFELTRRGRYKVIYSFHGWDGSGPEGGLIDVKGTFYGTTYGGGADNYGTVFSITPSGKESIIHTFTGWANGFYPNGPLLYVKGALYGTADGGVGGGDNHAGIIYSLTPGGQYTILHDFQGSTYGDGYFPMGGLINVGGTLYGATFYGGTGDGSACGTRYDHYGCGTVFSITPSGTERVVYSFAGPPDGYRPAAGLVAIDGTLYGTTALGGASSGGEEGSGTVFSVNNSGVERVLHTFTGPPDGWAPTAPLFALDGILYGTTQYGGTHKCRHRLVWCGTLFEVTTSGSETVLHNFTGYKRVGNPDGAFPHAGLIAVNGALVGVTEYGGAHARDCGVKHRRGCGAIFSITP